MAEGIEWTANPMKRTDGPMASVEFLSKQEIGKVRNFHKSFSEYQETPLRSLDTLAGVLGVAGVYVKDESYRFGLNAFKVLGSSYAVGNYLAKKLGKDISEVSFADLISPAVKQKLGDITFTTATDGNHGRGLAWTANRLQQKSVVYMPKGSSVKRLNAIKGEGAEAYITEYNYDDAVRLSASQAQKHGWVIVQDTAWEGYEDIPAWIMQGYGTMAAEALDQLNRMEVERPTHIFVQAGVGSLAGAVQGFFASVFRKDRPITVIVEADRAACLYKSAQVGDGKPQFVGGDMDTIMAGLACGEPNTISWEILRDYSDLFVSCSDWVTALGMRVLSSPAGSDPRIISGESGAVTSGLLYLILREKGLESLREKLKLDRNSRVLLFSTEGDTDPEKYASIVWGGEYPALQSI